MPETAPHIDAGDYGTPHKRYKRYKRYKRRRAARSIGCKRLSCVSRGSQAASQTPS